LLSISQVSGREGHFPMGSIGHNIS